MSDVFYHSSTVSIVIRALSIYDLIAASHYGISAQEIMDRFPSWYGDRDPGQKTAGYRKIYRDLELLVEAAPVLSLLRQGEGDGPEKFYIHARHAHRVELIEEAHQCR